MSQLLLTGFGPFLKVTDNPSGALARRFDGRSVGSTAVRGFELPVVFPFLSLRLLFLMP